MIGNSVIGPRWVTSKGEINEFARKQTTHLVSGVSVALDKMSKGQTHNKPSDSKPPQRADYVKNLGGFYQIEPDSCVHTGRKRYKSPTRPNIISISTLETELLVRLSLLINLPAFEEFGFEERK